MPAHRQLQNALGAPVGIVGCNWGGTRACCWMSEAYLQNEAGALWLEDYKNNMEGIDAADYCRVYRSDPSNIPNHPIPGPFPQITYPGLTREQQLEAMKRLPQMHQQKYGTVIGPDHPWRPCGLYHTMLEKIVPYTAAGVLWYQGESDDAHPEIYDQVLSNLIQNWRSIWQEELPFLIVQLAPFEAWLDAVGTNYPLLRMKQEYVAETVPHVYLCSNSDSGMRWDIHPKHKRPVGERLALLARGHIYGEDVLCDAPVFESAIRNGSEAVLRFRNADGLHLKGNTGNVNALQINGVPAIARIEGDSLIVALPEAAKWAITFACTNYYEVNLYNAADIPAIPFSIMLENR